MSDDPWAWAVTGPELRSDDDLPVDHLVFWDLGEAESCAMDHNENHAGDEFDAPYKVVPLYPVAGWTRGPSARRSIAQESGSQDTKE